MCIHHRGTLFKFLESIREPTSSLIINQQRNISLLQLGCGHGLPGMFACLEGAAAIHFQDFNGKVVWCLTIPNVNSNIPSFQPPSVQVTKSNVGSEIRFFCW